MMIESIDIRVKFCRRAGRLEYYGTEPLHSDVSQDFRESWEAFYNKLLQDEKFFGNLADDVFADICEEML